MTMTQEERFASVVRAQAEARVDGDNLTFGGYLLPEAVNRAGGGPAREFEVLEAKSDGGEGTSLVRYIGPSGAGSYVLKQQWRRVDDAWRVASIERPADMVEGASGWYKAIGFLRKIYQFGPNPAGSGRVRRR
jgi:hypothetical protein